MTEREWLFTGTQFSWWNFEFRICASASSLSSTRECDLSWRSGGAGGQRRRRSRRRSDVGGIKRFLRRRKIS
jgi:hypothetical protein